MEYVKQGHFIRVHNRQGKVVLEFDVDNGMPQKFRLHAHEAEQLGVELIAMSDRLRRENCNEVSEMQAKAEAVKMEMTPRD